MTDFTPEYETLVEKAPIGVFQVAVTQENLVEATADPEDFYVNNALADILSFDSPEHFRWYE